MIRDYYVTKRHMAQAWTKQGKRVVVTKLHAPDLAVIKQLSPKQNNSDNQDRIMLEVGFGKKKLKNMAKSLRTQLERSDFSFGVRNIKGIEWFGDEEAPKAGATIALDSVLSVGDVVDVQGLTKGRGFAGGVKRHGFHGGPKTHGQSDRHRAVGSIGAGTSPGHVWKGKRMPGHYGVETHTVQGLVVVYIDPDTNEVWVSGPVPGSFNSIVRLRKTSQSRPIDLDRIASGLPAETKTEASTEAKPEPSTDPKVESDTQEQSKEQVEETGESQS